MLGTLLLVQLIIHGIDGGERSFECPKDCPLNLYEPICARGISYTSLCTLQLEICSGKLEDEVYADIEKCFKFTSDRDKQDAAAVDKNGVILRSFFLDNRNETDTSSSVLEDN